MTSNNSFGKMNNLQMPRVGIRRHSEDWPPNSFSIGMYFTKRIMTWFYSGVWMDMKHTWLLKRLTRDPLSLMPMDILWLRKFSERDITGWLWEPIISNMSRSVTSLKSMQIRYVFHILPWCPYCPLTFLYAGYKHNCDDRGKNCDRMPFHLSSYRLLHQVGKSYFVYQSDEASNCAVLRKGYHLTLRGS